jgi:hypothetical protein
VLLRERCLEEGKQKFRARLLYRVDYVARDVAEDDVVEWQESGGALSHACPKVFDLPGTFFDFPLFFPPANFPHRFSTALYTYTALVTSHI